MKAFLIKISKLILIFLLIVLIGCDNDIIEDNKLKLLAEHKDNFNNYCLSHYEWAQVPLHHNVYLWQPQPLNYIASWHTSIDSQVLFEVNALKQHLILSKNKTSTTITEHWRDNKTNNVIISEKIAVFIAVDKQAEMWHKIISTGLLSIKTNSTTSASPYSLSLQLYNIIDTTYIIGGLDTAANQSIKAFQDLISYEIHSTK